eukprot:4051297-Pleurochrysis_carterae.AAC.1
MLRQKDRKDLNENVNDQSLFNQARTPRQGEAYPKHGIIGNMGLRVLWYMGTLFSFCHAGDLFSVPAVASALLPTGLFVSHQLCYLVRPF